MEERKTTILAVAGKGGVGKTSVAATMVRLLCQMHPGKRILAIDADPAVGLATALGVEVCLTVDDIRKVVVALPRMSALGADVRAVRSLDCVMLEAMAESVCPLCGGQFRQSLAQSCDFLLYGCSRFHNQKLNRLGCCTSCAVALVAVLGLLRFCNLRTSSS